jgi:hypothetical protein
MSLTGKSAVETLKGETGRCDVYRKDSTDKMWSYRMKAGSRREFAFDPKTTTKLVIRLDVAPPAMEGITDEKNIQQESVSTALGRVFSGGDHIPKWKARVKDEAALRSLLDYLAKL